MEQNSEDWSEDDTFHDGDNKGPWWLALHGAGEDLITHVSTTQQNMN